MTPVDPHEIRKRLEAGEYEAYYLSPAQDIRRLLDAVEERDREIERLRGALELSQQFVLAVRARVALKEPHYTASSVLKTMLEAILNPAGAARAED
jgi:predicted urease superfamily metal-dependent hydrolase